MRHVSDPEGTNFGSEMICRGCHGIPAWEGITFRGNMCANHQDEGNTGVDLGGLLLKPWPQLVGGPLLVP